MDQGPACLVCRTHCRRLRPRHPRRPASVRPASLPPPPITAPTDPGLPSSARPPSIPPAPVTAPDVPPSLPPFPVAPKTLPAPAGMSRGPVAACPNQTGRPRRHEPLNSTGIAVCSADCSGQSGRSSRHGPLNCVDITVCVASRSGTHRPRGARILSVPWPRMFRTPLPIMIRRLPGQDDARRLGLPSQPPRTTPSTPPAQRRTLHPRPPRNPTGTAGPATKLDQDPFAISSRSQPSQPPVRDPLDPARVNDANQVPPTTARLPQPPPSLRSGMSCVAFHPSQANGPARVPHRRSGVWGRPGGDAPGSLAQSGKMRANMYGAYQTAVQPTTASLPLTPPPQTASTWQSP